MSNAEGKVIPMPGRAEVNSDNIPEELRNIDRWVLWKYEQKFTAEGTRWTKPPYQTNGSRGSHSNPATWTTFNNVLSVLQKSNMFHGVGFVMGYENLVAWDLDHCLNPKTLDVMDWAQEIVDEMNSYTEITPSGEGFRIFVRGEIPNRSKNARGFRDFRGSNEGGVECYSEVRFVTLTGNHWPRSPQKIETRNVEETWHRVFDKKPSEIKSLLKNELMMKLWNGEFQDIMRPGSDPPERMYGSQSEADLALVRQLIISTEGDGEAADRLFRQSKLMRSKWSETGHWPIDHCDACRGLGLTTFGQHTIAVALKSYHRSYNLTDVGNAKRFARLHGDKVRYCNTEWFVWDGKRLELDQRQSIYLLADAVSKELNVLAAEVADEERRKAIVKHARSLESRGQIESMMKLSQARPPIPVLPRDLDDHDMWFCCDNGVLENAEKFREHKFADLITKISPIRYNPHAKAPQWNAFLQEIMPSDEILLFLQKAIGYSLTGSTREQKFFIAYGTGQNGKSVFFHAVAKVMGDYFSRIPTSAIMETRNEQHPTSLMMFKGTRLTLASEVKENRQLNEDLIKAITGESELQARGMYQNLATFRSTSKLWIMTNHEPYISGTDLGIWRRVVKIPFTVTIPDARVDVNLAKKLDGELEGILAWCVEGWRRWEDEGLEIPTPIRVAIDEYRADMDVIKAFVDEECEIDSKAKMSHSSLYETYTRWADRNGYRPMSSKAFSSKMAEKKDATGKPMFSRVRGNDNVKFWSGLTLKNREQERSDI